MSRRSLALLAAVLVLALGVGWLALHESQDRARVVESNAHAVTDSNAAPQVALALPDAHDATDAERSSSRAAAAVDPDSDIPADALWVEGRVEFPPDTPRDERAFVVAYGLKYGDSSQHRFEVGADGRFRAAFAAGTKHPLVGLAARYLYIDKPANADATSVAAGLVLRPSLGACLRLTLAPSRIAAARSPDLPRATVTADGSRPAARSQSLSGTFDARGFVELGGLAPDAEWKLDIRLPGFHSASIEPIESTAGASIERRVELRASPRLTGVVRDTRGDPVSEVAIRLTTTDGFADRYGSAQSDAAGRFVIFSGRLEQVVVRALKDEFLEARVGPFDLEEGGERNGLEFVLATGLEIRGLVRWPDGRPTVGATVQLVGAPGGAGQDSRAQTRQTGEDGSFTFHALNDLRYRITARARVKRAEASVGRPASDEWFAFNPSVPGGTSGVVLILSAGSVVHGRVVDDLGAPVSGVGITAQCTGPMQDVYGRTEAGKTDTAGRFEWRSAGDADWTVRAQARAGYFSTPQPLHLPRDAERELVFVLARPAAIEGSVSNLDGSAAVGATVRAAPSDARSDGARQSATTDAGGRFRIDAIAAVPLTVRAESQDRAPSSMAEITPMPGEVVSVELTLLPGGTIVGHVLDLHDRPRAGETVGWDPGSPGSQSRSTRTAADGSFRFEGIEPGRSSVWAREEPAAAGLSGISVATASGESYGILSADIVMEPGATVEVDLGGSPKGPIRVRGSVRAKQLIPGVTIQFYPVDQSEGDVAEMRGAHSDTSGNYVLRLAGSGSYIVMAEAPGLASVSLRIEITSASEQVVDIGFGTSTISGVVLGPDGKPAEGVRVSARQQDGESSDHVMSFAEVATSDDGTFELGGLLPGSYKVRASPAAFGSSATAACSPVERSDVVLAAGQTRDGLELRLTQGCSVLVRVVNAGGSPVVRAQVTFDLYEDLRGDATDSAGAVLLTNLRPGLLTLSARTKTDAERESVQVVAALERTAEATVTLIPGGRVALRLERSDGVAISQGLSYPIDFLDESGQIWRKSLTDIRGGVLVFGPMRPGAYTVSARFGTKQAEARVEVVAGSESEVVLREPQ